MDKSIPIRVKDLSKTYKLYSDRSTSIKYRILDLFKGKTTSYKELYALSDISFQVPAGQTLGIIGENGSGKSTLLKILAGIMEPTKGELNIKGNISSLLELGSGFASELSGRKNIYLNGSILGFKREKIQECFDDIVSYSELEEFIDIPIKNYSSGMLMRLGFAIAIKVDPDILLIDEVLAVGDEGFQRKCFEDITLFKRKRKTIVFVSHDAYVVEKLCDRVILLNKGKIICDGAADNVIRKYRLMLSDKDSSVKKSESGSGSKEFVSTEDKHSKERHGSREAEINSIQIIDNEGKPSASIESGTKGKLAIKIDFQNEIDNPIFGFIVRKDDGQRLIDVYDTNTQWQNIKTGFYKKGESIKIFFDLDFSLGRGEYYFTCAIANKDATKFYDWRENCLKLWIEEKGTFRAIADLGAKITIER
jgi:ABC-type polysaccharide/polyol phosphate transport system ATPase subunit